MSPLREEAHLVSRPWNPCPHCQQSVPPLLGLGACRRMCCGRFFQTVIVKPGFCLLLGRGGTRLMFSLAATQTQGKAWGARQPPALLPSTSTPVNASHSSGWHSNPAPNGTGPLSLSTPALFNKESLGPNLASGPGEEPTLPLSSLPGL